MNSDKARHGHSFNGGCLSSWWQGQEPPLESNSEAKDQESKGLAQLLQRDILEEFFSRPDTGTVI